MPKPSNPPIPPQGTTNLKPNLNDYTFSIAENSAENTVVGTATATDPNKKDVLTYSIDSGNDGNAFAINPQTGQITVQNEIDYEFDNLYELIVRATDPKGLFDTGIVTVNANNVNESPNLDNETFSVDENSAEGTVVGTVQGVDPDANDVLTYAITSGNDAGLFAIDPDTGEITVAGAIDYETPPTSHLLEVSATDAGGLEAFGEVTINVGDVEEQTFPPGSIVGTSGNDSNLEGTDEADNIFGLAGNDTIIGKLGEDNLQGGTGADTFVIQREHDIYNDIAINGTEEQATDDTIFIDVTDTTGAQFGFNEMDTSVQYIDQFLFSSPARIILTDGILTTADANNDGNFGDLFIFGEEGAQGTVNANTDTDTDTSITVDATNFEFLSFYGTPGDDLVINASGGSTEIYGNAGDDELHWSSGDQIIRGGAGDDLIDGGSNSDKLIGGEGNDTFYGGTGIDEFWGDAGDDTFVFQGHEDLNWDGGGIEGADFINEFQGAGQPGGDFLRLEGFTENATLIYAGDYNYFIEDDSGLSPLNLPGQDGVLSTDDYIFV